MDIAVENRDIVRMFRKKPVYAAEIAVSQNVNCALSCDNCRHAQPDLCTRFYEQFQKILGFSGDRMGKENVANLMRVFICGFRRSRLLQVWPV